MSTNKSSKKGNLIIWFIVIIVIVAIAGIALSVSQYRKSQEIKLSDTNNTLNEIAVNTGLVDKSEGSFYITLYVTAAVIVILGVGIFVYVHKKADE